MCSDRKPLKTVVFRHSSAALGVLAKEMKGLSMGSVGYTPVSSFCRTRPHLWGSSHSTYVAISLSAPADASLQHPPLTIFWAFKFSKSLPGIMFENTEVFITWMEPNRCSDTWYLWYPLWYPICFLKGFKTVYLMCLILPFPPCFSLNSFLWVNSICLKR